MNENLVLKASMAIVEDILSRYLDAEAVKDLKRMLDSGEYMSQGKLKDLSPTDEEMDAAVELAAAILENCISLID